MQSYTLQTSIRYSYIANSYFVVIIYIKLDDVLTMQSLNYQEFQKELGSRIQKYRKSRCLSQEGFAELLDMHRVSIGYIEQGKQAPKLSTLFRMAEILEVPLKDLLP
ncbi:MAG: helix-turn-helix domain-containing protein [Coriobacteriia bacterium]|nr:helix-turn-helix domain-containing protein [Coriobacteriia bacterium]